jgi:hypothetical protein
LPSAHMRSSSANARRSLHHVACHATRCRSPPARHHDETHSDFSDRLACEPTLPSPWSMEIPTRCCEVWCRYHFRTACTLHINPSRGMAFSAFPRLPRLTLDGRGWLRRASERLMLGGGGRADGREGRRHYTCLSAVTDHADSPDA